MSVSPAGTLEPVLAGASGTDAQPRRLSRRVAIDIVGCLDALAVVLGATLPAYIYAAVGGIDVNPVIIVKAALVTALVLFFCMQSWGMYDTDRLNDLPVYPGRMMFALALATLAALGLGVPFSIAEVHLWVWYTA
jgi:hypothetical protein